MSSRGLNRLASILKAQESRRPQVARTEATTPRETKVPAIDAWGHWAKKRCDLPPHHRGIS